MRSKGKSSAMMRSISWVTFRSIAVVAQAFGSRKEIEMQRDTL